VRAGTLRSRLAVQLPTDAITAAGDSVPVWNTVGYRWGAIEPIAGREFTEAGRVDADVTHQVRIRYYDGLTARYRFSFGSRILNIATVANTDERNYEMVCQCKEDV